LRRGQSAFWRKGDVIVQAQIDKRLVQMINTIHEATVVSEPRKERPKTKPVNKVTLFCFPVQ
jgi:translation initiation factor IF-2